jgi:hypothetical protein
MSWKMVWLYPFEQQDVHFSRSVLLPGAFVARVPPDRYREVADADLMGR